MKKYNKIFFTLGLMFLVYQNYNGQTPCVNGMVAGYPCENVDLWAFVSFDEMGGGTYANDIWGWTDQASGREFALVGKNNGTSFVEITDPGNPIYLGSLITHTSNSTWRDIKVYQNHAFIVSEAGGHGMQVFDLTQLLTTETPQDFEESAHYDGFGGSHNLAINEDTGFAYSVGDNTFSSGLHIIDISDPLNPTLAGGFSDDGYVHDCQSVVYSGPDEEYQGKEIVFAADEDDFAIIDVSDKTDCQLISATYYAESAYTHQCWLTKDQRFLIFGDELDELNNFTDVTRTYVYNVEDLDNPYQVTIFEGTTPAIDHNLYTFGNIMYQSNYKAGLRITDIGGIEAGNIIERGFFDCYPSNDNTSFGGTWSNYPYFPSGNVILTNSGTGFMIVKPQIFHLTADIVQVDCSTNSADFELTIPTELSSTSFSLSIEGLPGSPSISSGEINVPGTTNISISGLDDLPGGVTSFQIILNGDYGQYIIPAAVENNSPATPDGLTPSNNSEIQSNEAVLSWNNIEAVSYEIIFSQNSDLSDPIVTGTSSTPTYDFENDFDNLSDGTYYWAVVSINACGSSISEIFSFEYVSFVSVTEFNTQSISVYPNPTSGMLTIEGIQSQILLNVTDVTGRIIYSKEFTPMDTTIDLSDLTPGIYFLKTVENKIIEKIILK